MRIKILHIQVLPKLSGVQKVSLEIFKKLNNEKYDKYILSVTHLVMVTGLNVLRSLKQQELKYCSQSTSNVKLV